MANIREQLEIQRKESKKIHDYFNKCLDSIDNNNRYMLRKSCMYISIVYLFMIALAYIVVPEFKINKFHFTMVPFLTLYYFINLNMKKRKNVSTLETSITCLSFYFLFSMHFLLIDVIESPDHSAMWFPLILVCFPTVFIDKIYKYLIEEIFVIVLFLCASYNMKTEYIFRHDVYIISAAFCLSILMANILLRVRSYEALSKDEIERISSIDALTMTLNKRALLEAINEYYSSRPPENPCAICIIDVDNFKHVNDKLGHNNGDLLLSHIGQLLRKSFRRTDIIGRFGGDEFIVFMPGISNKSLVEMRCRTMQMLLSDFTIDPSTVFTLSIGCVIDCVGLPYDKIFPMADDALYQSKQVGKNCCTAWSVENTATFLNPMLLLATEYVTEGTSLLEMKQSFRYDIIRAYNGTDALKLLSQYHDGIRIAIVHFDLKDISGLHVIRYIKTRTGFESIRVLAVCSNEEERSIAKEAGADISMIFNENDDDFENAINELSN